MTRIGAPPPCRSTYTDRAGVSVRTALGLAIGLVGLLGLLLVTVAAITDSTPALRLVRGSSESLSAADPTCAARSRDPGDAGPWRRVWSLAGEVSVNEIDGAGFTFWPARKLVVLEHATRIEPKLPRTVQGDWSDDGGRASLFASDTDVPFGFSFELLDGSGATLCGLTVTLPLDGANISYRFEPVTRLEWLSLGVGERAASDTRSGEELAITRLAESEWEFVIDGSGRAGNYVHQVRLLVTADQPLLPWDTIDLDLDFDTSEHRATAHLELRPPVLCPTPDGEIDPCP